MSHRKLVVVNLGPMSEAEEKHMYKTIAKLTKKIMLRQLSESREINRGKEEKGDCQT